MASALWDSFRFHFRLGFLHLSLICIRISGNEMSFATCFTQAKHKNSFASRNKTTLQNKWWGKVFTSAEYTCICSHSRHTRTIRKSKKDNLRSSNRVAIAWLSPRLICNLHCTIRLYATHFADVSWLRGTEMPRPSSSMAAPLMMLPLGVLRVCCEFYK